MKQIHLTPSQVETILRLIMFRSIELREALDGSDSKTEKQIIIESIQLKAIKTKLE